MTGRKPKQRKTYSGVLSATSLGRFSPGVTDLVWSPSGERLACLLGTSEVVIVETETGSVEMDHSWAPVKQTPCTGMTWNSKSDCLAISTRGNGLLLMDLNMPAVRETESAFLTGALWLPNNKIVVASDNWDGFLVMDPELRLSEAYFVEAWWKGPRPIWAVSPDGETLAFVNANGSVQLIRVEDWGKRLEEIRPGTDVFVTDVNCITWSPDGTKLALGCYDNSVRVVETAGWNQIAILEGYSMREWFVSTKPMQGYGMVGGLSFSSDGLLLGISGVPPAILGVQHWREINETQRLIHDSSAQLLRFSPSEDTVAVVTPKGVATWKYDPTILLRGIAGSKSVKRVRAKVVLLGESNVGKSYLAVRLTEQRYPKDGELETTHGMRIWRMAAGSIDRDDTGDLVEREVVIWDLGGQQEYRLVHQLFLHDADVILIVFDPTRGEDSFKQVEEWNKRLEKQLGRHRGVVKILVGCKMDKPDFAVDRVRIDELLRACDISDFFETSAKTGRGIAELVEGLAKVLDWETLAMTCRPELYQRIRDEIERRTVQGERVLVQADLVSWSQRQFPRTLDPDAIYQVIEHLCREGLIARTYLESGDPVLVLQIADVERYASSLIISARLNPRGVPAVERKTVLQPGKPVPRITDSERLPPDEERIILESVARLLVERGICFEHEGLLIFPSLFRLSHQKAAAEVMSPFALCYDFSGPIDQIYASLVVQLAILKEFGLVRLWQNQAEFERLGSDVFGLRKVDREGGSAHLDVYFGEQADHKEREVFSGFVKQHLRKYANDVIEYMEMTCAYCSHRFSETTIRKRIELGKTDIWCPECDQKNVIGEDRSQSREVSKGVPRKVFILRSGAEEKQRQMASRVARSLKKAGVARKTAQLRLLHISDLHFTKDVSVQAKVQPLIADLKDKRAGLGMDFVDFIVISGDLTQHGTPEEFRKAHEFISRLVSKLGISAERVILVPGNHDSFWDWPELYDWCSARRADALDLEEGSYVKQGAGFLIKNSQRYGMRFKYFSDWLYHPLLQQQYPLEFDKQCLVFTFPDEGVQFITLNSAWESDEWFKERASINLNALAKGLETADEHRKSFMSEESPILRIAALHHPVRGRSQIQDESFLGHLAKADVSLVLHGHVHEDAPDAVRYCHGRTLRVAGAGTFGAPAIDRPESIPRLYNVLELAPDQSKVTVHTRCAQKDTSAWGGWAVWPSDGEESKRAYYEIELT